jgi:hypothetical protein
MTESEPTKHTKAYIDAEDYREKANGVVAGLDIQHRQEGLADGPKLT